MPDPKETQPTPTPPTQNPGAFRLFRIWGITVYLHWLWFVIIIFMVQGAAQANVFQFANPVLWCSVVYLALFLIVLMHEFGHSLACRSVGGRADRIVLWPLGGIAFVQPPQRPGAVLWSIIAGPLVNVVLVPVTLGAWLALEAASPESDATMAMQWIAGINLVLLAFNMLPIYPLDGGQTLQSILWFFVGRVKSLKIAAGIGVVCAAVGGLAALAMMDLWLVIIAGFVGLQAWRGLAVARDLAQMQEQGYRVEEARG